MIKEPEVVLKMFGFVLTYFQAAAITDIGGILPYLDNVGTIVVLLWGLRYFMKQADKTQEKHQKQLDDKDQEFSVKWKAQEDRHIEAIKELRAHYTELFKAQQEMFGNSDNN